MKDWEKWDLKISIANFIVPRLESYINEVENNNIVSIPLWIRDIELPFVIAKDREYSDEEIFIINREWEKILKKILFSFKSILEPQNEMNFEEIQKKQEEGLQLFAKYYLNLWD
ncbi:hypothetical protein [Chryseobacterium takakiae]|uniref:Uncharacterized protein n=1 Tax=Chryseobacterium takakiae TaxID=1302685 RepID=A0A1M4UH39_9FLAO|nr:hypothetical protein [Chryseobacterium takakiae]SHE55903.1 hypothetical protein SAMN05444408_10299 [Chryseobacterium takakiae]